MGQCESHVKFAVFAIHKQPICRGACRDEIVVRNIASVEKVIAQAQRGIKAAKIACQTQLDSCTAHTSPNLAGNRIVCA